MEDFPGLGKEWAVLFRLGEGCSLHFLSACTEVTTVASVSHLLSPGPGTHACRETHEHQHRAALLRQS